MKTYSEITGRYLKQNKRRTILTIVGIILAISLFSGMGNLFFSMRDDLVENKRKTIGNFEVMYSGVNKDKVNKLRNNFEIKDYGVSKDENYFILKDDKNANVSNEKINATNKGNNENSNVQNGNNIEKNKPKLISLDFYDNSMFNNVMTINMKEGKKPKASNEIILEKRAKKKIW